MSDVLLTPQVPSAAELPAPRRPSAWRELRRDKLFWGALAMIAVLLAIAVAPGLFTGVGPNRCDLGDSLRPPGSGHWFGTDLQGCDVYARSIYGARASIAVGVLVALGTVLVGGTLGALAGFYRGWVDTLLSRLADVFLGIPLILGAIAVLSLLTTRGVIAVVVVLTALGWANVFRMTRSSVIATRDADYVTAARALGAGDLRLLRRHVLPNAFAPVLVVATTSLGVYITTEATLSFLSLGLQPPAISWGLMISDAQSRFTDAPYTVLFPACLLGLTVLAFSLLGDAVRDALDPKLRT